MPLSQAEKESLALACKAPTPNLSQIVTILKSHKGDYQTLDPIYIALCESEPEAAVLLIKDRLKKGTMTSDFLSAFIPQLGWTPLMLASNTGNVDLIDIILSVIKDAEIDRYSSTADLTPLYVACSSGQSEVAKRLLKTGKVDVNRTFEVPAEVLGNGKVILATPLFAAIVGSREKVCDLDVFKLLIRSGASLLINGKDILELNLDNKKIDKEVVPYLKRIKALRAAQSYVHEQRPELFKAKKELFDAIDSATKDKVVALAKVKQLIQKHPELLSALDEHNDAPKEGDSPLHRACRVGCLEIVQTLLAAGDNANRTKVGSNGTALYIASQEGHTAIVSCLLENRALVDFENVYKVTALVAACDKKRIDAARVLVEKGNANVDKVNEKGRSCLDIANEKCPEIAAILKAKGAHTSVQLKEMQNGKQPAVSPQPAVVQKPATTNTTSPAVAPRAATPSTASMLSKAPIYTQIPNPALQRSSTPTITPEPPRGLVHS